MKYPRYEIVRKCFDNIDSARNFKCDNDSNFGLIKRKAYTHQNKKNLHILV